MGVLDSDNRSLEKLAMVLRPANDEPPIRECQPRGADRCGRRLTKNWGRCRWSIKRHKKDMKADILNTREQTWHLERRHRRILGGY